MVKVYHFGKGVTFNIVNVVWVIVLHELTLRIRCWLVVYDKMFTCWVVYHEIELGLPRYTMM